MIRTHARRIKRTVKKALTRRDNPLRTPTGAAHEWSIGIYVGESPVSLRPAEGIRNPVLTRDDVLDVPAAFAADPFMIRHGRLWHLFFEVMNTRTMKGEIAHATSKDGLKWRYGQIVLSEPFHLSYPYVFEWKNAIYMIPETHQDSSVRLYRAEPFPHRWKLTARLLTGAPFADASVFRYLDRWWMFVETSGRTHDLLRLYHADDLQGPWHEHVSSPLIEGNPHTARPAGRAQVVGDKIIRYAQSCYPTYGTEVRAFEIGELTPAAYAEQPAANQPMLGPSGYGWNASGMHHVDAHRVAEGRWLACVDGWIGV